MPARAAIVLCWLATQAAAIALTLDTSVEVQRVSANGNEITRVQNEIGFIASRVAPDAGSIDLKIVEATPDDPVVKLNLSGAKLEQTQGERILQTLERYVRLRLEGHTQQFATFVVLHGGEPWPNDLREVTARVPSLRESIAFPWVRREVSAPMAFPTQGETHNRSVLYVIDGDIAWVYLIPKKPKAEADEIIKIRFDAIEFSPAASAVIRSVFDDLKREGRVPTPEKSPGAAWWFEFQERLKQKAGLHWRTPAELNPEAQFE